LASASQDLYANEWQTFWNVTFPSIRTAILGAGLLVFTLSLAEIAVTFFLVGRPNTLPLQIWGLLRRGITPEVNAAATIIFLVSVVVIVVWARLMREEDRTRSARPAPRKCLIMQSRPPCQALNHIGANKLLCCMQIRPPAPASGRMTRGLDKGWGSGATMAEYQPPRRWVRLHPPTKRRVHSHS
jgi:hypothetical protein